MSLTTRTFTLCVVPNRFPPHIEIAQYDTAVECTANLVDESTAAFSLPSGSTAVLQGINRKNVPFDIPATVNGSSVTFAPSGPMVDCYGQQMATLAITNGGEQFSPLAIIFEIQKAGRTKEETAGSQEFRDAIQEAFEEKADEIATVYFDYDADEDEVTGMTLAQLEPLIQNGVPVVCRITCGSSLFYAPFKRHKFAIGHSQQVIESNMYTFDGMCVADGSGEIWVYSFRFYSDGSYSYNEGSLAVSLSR